MKMKFKSLKTYEVSLQLQLIQILRARFHELDFHGYVPHANINMQLFNHNPILYQ